MNSKEKVEINHHSEVNCNDADTSVISSDKNNKTQKRCEDNFSVKFHMFVPQSYNDNKDVQVGIITSYHDWGKNIHPLNFQK
jgi:hypothetical protein